MQNQEILTTMVIFSVSSIATFGLVWVLQMLLVPYSILKTKNPDVIYHKLHFYRLPITKKLAQHLYEINIKHLNISNVLLLRSNFNKILKPVLLSTNSTSPEFTGDEIKILEKLKYVFDEKEKTFELYVNTDESIKINVKKENGIRFYEVKVGSKVFKEFELEKILFG